jgi:uncharacterized protein
MRSGEGIEGPGEDRTRTVPLEERAVPAAGWPRTDRVFAAAATAIGLHLADSRDAGSFPMFLLDALLAAAGVFLTVAAFRHSGPRRRGLVALVAGSAATIAGLGADASRIWKFGVAGLDLTGAVSLAAGLVLLALGTTVLVRATRGWRRLLALPAALLMIGYVFVPLTIAVYLTHSPRAALGGRTPGDEGLPYRDMTLTARDGTRLAAWYVPSRNGGAVVLLHGSGSSRLNVLDHLGVLGRAGYGVVAVDGRGHGHSEGQPMDLGWKAPLDIGAGVSFLSRRPEVDPGRIAVLGVSSGGAGALLAAAEDPRVDAVISEGIGVTSFPDALRLGPDRWWKIPFYWMGTTGSDLLSPAAPPVPMDEALDRVVPRPVLLISGRGTDERFLNRHLVERGGPTTELLALPDTKHSLGIWSHPDRWTGRVLGFLDRALAA